MFLLKIHREVDHELLRKQRRLKVKDCDKQKILALIGALFFMGPKGIVLSKDVLGSLIKGGIAVEVEGEPDPGKSVFVRVFDESIELRLARPS